MIQMGRRAKFDIYWITRYYKHLSALILLVDVSVCLSARRQL